MSETNAAPTETPATLPIGQAQDLDTYRGARDKGLTEIPNPSAKAAPAIEAPDPDVEANPELRKEVDAIEAPKDTESPQEKAARTKRNKEQAQKRVATRRQNEITALKQELGELRQRLTAPPSGGNTIEPRKGTEPAKAEPVNDPTDPEPTLEAFMKAHPDHPDHYNGHIRELAKWDRRQEAQQADATRRADAQRAEDVRTREQLQAHATEAAAKHTDYDETIDALDLALGTHPANDLITRFCAHSPAKGELAYRLGKDIPALVAAVKAGRDRLIAHLGAVEAAVAAGAKPVESSKPLTAAPAPHTPVGGGASAHATRDPKSITSLEEWRGSRDAIFAAGGR